MSRQRTETPTNEEIVAEIQATQNTHIKNRLLGKLWRQVEMYVRKKANAAYKKYRDPHFEFDDLYDSGYIALSEAVRTYSSDKEVSFISWFTLYLKTAFAEVMGCRTAKQSKDPLNGQYISFDMPVSGENEVTYSEILPDPTNDYEAADDRINNAELAKLLDKMLDSIPENEAQVLRRYYYNKESFKAIAESMGVTVSQTRTMKSRGLTCMRRPSEDYRRLCDYIDLRTNYYLRVNAKSQTSPVEINVIRRNQYVHDYYRQKAQGKLY